MDAELIPFPESAEQDSTLHEQTFSSEFVDAELIPFPESAEQARNVQKSVATVAQRQSESKQALDSLSDIDGVLFLDGAVLPLGVVYWVLLDYAGERSPAGSWDRPTEILQNYIKIIEQQYERELPVIGVVKTSSMAQVLSALRAKIKKHDIRDDSGRLEDVPWVRDHQFIADVLRHDDLDYLTYTSWFIHQRQQIGGQSFDLLEPLANKLSHGTPEDYRRAFFYVRLPKTGDILRVETPALFIQNEQWREEIQLKALKEIAQRRGEPRAIQRADRLVRISRQNREKIREMLERTESSYDHNWDGRWSELEDDNPER